MISYLKDPFAALGVTIPDVPPAPAKAAAVTPAAASSEPVAGPLGMPLPGIERLLPLAVLDGRLRLDTDSFKSLETQEVKNREDAKAQKRLHVAQRLGLPPDQIPDHMVQAQDRWGGIRGRNPRSVCSCRTSSLLSAIPSGTTTVRA